MGSQSWGFRDEPGVRIARVTDPLTSLRRNRLLAQLPTEDLARLLPGFELVELPGGRTLHEAGQPITHLHFPLSAIISMLHVAESGTSVEIAMVGNEAAVGLSALMGGEPTGFRAVVQAGGQSMRIPRQLLQDEFRRAGALTALLWGSIQAQMLQAAQAALCNRHHSLDLQLCRWLLQSLDRRPGADLALTHELIAAMLGVRREGVTESARKLQAAGLIRYSRGHVVVLDRDGLEARSCECYALLRPMRLNRCDGDGPQSPRPPAQPTASRRSTVPEPRTPRN